MFLREDDQVLMLFDSLRVEGDVKASVMPVVCVFPDVFTKDIIDLPLEHEVEFAINLVPGTRYVSMALYRQLEHILKKMFVRPCVSSWGAPLFIGKEERR